MASRTGSNAGCWYHMAVRTSEWPMTFITVARFPAIDMDSCLSSEVRSRALAFNTSCLTRIGACETPKEMLPEVFGQQ